MRYFRHIYILWFILYSVVFCIFLRFIVKLSPLCMTFFLFFFCKGFHVSLVFFLCFRISYFFTVPSSRFLIVFLHHSFAQINNIMVLLFSMIIFISHESIFGERIAEQKDFGFIIDG